MFLYSSHNPEMYNFPQNIKWHYTDNTENEHIKMKWTLKIGVTIAKKKKKKKKNIYIYIYTNSQY